MLFIFFQCFIKDKDVVKINYNDLVDEILQNIVDYNLEYDWYIDKSK